MSKQLITLTDEQRAQMKPWAQKWIDIGLKTGPMTDDEKDKVSKTLIEMYEIIGKPKPRIVFVKSPLVGRFATGFAAAIWHRRRGGSIAKVDSEVNSAVDSAVDSEVESAVDSAVRSEVDSAVDSEVRSEVDSAVNSAVFSEVFSEVRSEVDSAVRSEVFSEVDSAVNSAVFSEVFSEVRSEVDSAVRSEVDSAVDSEVFSAVDSAVNSAVFSEVFSEVYSEVDSAVDSAVFSAVDSEVDSAVDSRDQLLSFNFDYRAMVSLSDKLNIGKFSIECAKKSWKMARGGNLWPAWAAFLSFFKDKIHLSETNLKKLELFETTSSLCGYHWLHDEFVIVSDRPTFIKTDDRGRSHSLDGPFVQWADGTSLYRVHGQKVPRYICDTPKEQITKEMILSEQNVDNRRYMIEKIGIDKAIALLGAETTDFKVSDVGGKYELLMIDYDGRGNKRPYLKMRSKSIDADHIEGVGPNVNSVEQAIMYRNKLKKFIEPQFLS